MPGYLGRVRRVSQLAGESLRRNSADRSILASWAGGSGAGVAVFVCLVAVEQRGPGRVVSPLDRV